MTEERETIPSAPTTIGTEEEEIVGDVVEESEDDDDDDDSELVDFLKVIDSLPAKTSEEEEEEDRDDDVDEDEEQEEFISFYNFVNVLRSDCPSDEAAAIGGGDGDDDDDELAAVLAGRRPSSSAATAGRSADGARGGDDDDDDLARADRRPSAADRRDAGDEEFAAFLSRLADAEGGAPPEGDGDGVGDAELAALLSVLRLPGTAGPSAPPHYEGEEEIWSRVVAGMRERRPGGGTGEGASAEDYRMSACLRRLLAFRPPEQRPSRNEEAEKHADEFPGSSATSVSDDPADEEETTSSWGGYLRSWLGPAAAVQPPATSTAAKESARKGSNDDKDDYVANAFEVPTDEQLADEMA